MPNFSQKAFIGLVLEGFYTPKDPTQDVIKEIKENEQRKDISNYL